ncbi:hypothetical protein Ctob_016489 [Chrysochromulina tobinii]|uniref:Uncharacterized protein n=1 Tax=Chrysochromulina tobinii TaxID=1460289 RepID=A0A0M0K5E9_9EUKA|nr:hypothetical protein Ctob_016489 [Chrysochromulina tobinii]|eukprot:KOO34024.1 hypothetical protein Ctob_016489 [Chrysochromulina sp. CCMP291]
MVRFATDPGTAHTLDETSAFRGAHVAIFEDDDKGTALKALVPSLSWMVADGAPALPFGEVADFMLRVMTWQAADRATQRLVITTGCCSARTQLIALTGVTLATSDFSSLSVSAAVFVLGWGSTGRCSARTQLIALPGMTLAAASGFSSLSISAAAIVLGAQGARS